MIITYLSSNSAVLKTTSYVITKISQNLFLFATLMKAKRLKLNPKKLNDNQDERSSYFFLYVTHILIQMWDFLKAMV